MSYFIRCAIKDKMRKIKEEKAKEEKKYGMD
jgi:hypothetical protein